MSFRMEITTDPEKAAKFIAVSISRQLDQNKHVLFFVPGGSSVEVVIRVAEILKDRPHGNLTVTLTDERYGPIDHFNSNFFQLKEKGFELPEATIIPVLMNDDIKTTTERFNKNLEEELKNAEYKIGLFGIGTDGHTAGILPESIALDSDNLVASYETPIFSRITITPKLIEQLDEAVAWVQGKDKWEIIENLTEDVSIRKQPAQILKNVPLLTIFSDFKI